MMSKRTIFLVVVLVAALAFNIFRAIPRQTAADGLAPKTDEFGAVVTESGPIARRQPLPPIESIDPDDAVSGAADSIVRVNAGVALKRVLVAGEFVGYRVVENSIDKRFSEGDVIIGVAGQPVDGSPGGGEILIAALADPYSVIDLQNPDAP